MSATVSHRGYDGSIIHDPEDHLYYGKILGIQDTVIYHGYTVEEAEGIFRTAVDDYLSDFAREGKTAPKPFASLPSNLPHELLLRAALFAQEHQVDIESVLQNQHTDFLAHAQ